MSESFVSQNPGQDWPEDHGILAGPKFLRGLHAFQIFEDLDQIRIFDFKDLKSTQSAIPAEGAFRPGHGDNSEGQAVKRLRHIGFTIEKHRLFLRENLPGQNERQVIGREAGARRELQAAIEEPLEDGEAAFG